jgi:hypothetical protein
MATSSVFGIASSQSHLRDIIDRLDREGFRRDDRSVLFPDQLSSHPLSHEKATKAPEGAVTGGIAGAGVGGILGILAGIGALAIPGVGPLIAAGPLLAMLSGAAVGAAAGGLTGSLIGLGIPEYEAKRYEQQLKEGGILIAVHVDNNEWEKKAKRVLTEAGATDIATAKETTKGGRATTAGPRARRTTRAGQPDPVALDE